MLFLQSRRFPKTQTTALLMSRTRRMIRPSHGTTLKRYRSVQQKPHLLLPNDQKSGIALDYDKNAFTCVEISISDEEIYGGPDGETRQGGDSSTRKGPSKFLPPNSTSTLQRMSSIASLLCLVDCTLLPAVTLVVPVLGLSKQGSDRLQFFHQVGHVCTLYFLLPIGCLSAITNYLVHRQRWIVTLAFWGLLLLAISNSYSEGSHLAVFHIFHQGSCHRIVNLLGCSCLLTSNHWSHQAVRRNTPQDADAACCILHQNQQRQQQKMKRWWQSQKVTTNLQKFLSSLAGVIKSAIRHDNHVQHTADSVV